MTPSGATNTFSEVILTTSISKDDMFVLVGNLENIRKRAPRHFGGESSSIHANLTIHTGIT